ncbi:hypothetical protein SKAU_G00202860 [Synaphobranchus kaupii]|uniref:Uncharacterized protein n=1 Tax=Synaphobranchus kaupii TaxID=118154 RepID=A0A9Q1FFT9_SYNKA|nr:hypothetical protein SKAU_G00202860 [Synaphobranchus kaupii]
MRQLLKCDSAPAHAPHVDREQVMFVQVGLQAWRPGARPCARGVRRRETRRSDVTVRLLTRLCAKGPEDAGAS